MRDRFLPTIATVLMLAVLPLALAACGGGGGDEEQQAAQTGEQAPQPDVYTVRGVVEKLPQADGPDKSLYVRHQAIAVYKDRSGNVVGMESMTMPFPVGPTVSLDGIAPGDPVEFTFEMVWEPQGRYQITALHELPADTQIEFDMPMHEGEHGHEGHDHGSEGDHQH